MPGTRLSSNEQRLHEWWNNGAFTVPMLDRLAINGAPGLRGIQDLHIQFDYPLTVLCGRNGNGKTTLLSLSALAFGGSDGHYPLNALRKSKAGENFTYYTFRDFFFRGPGDPNIAGITIHWDFRGPLQRVDGRPAISPLVVRKRGDKWMHYERRPSRPVHYVGVARSIPSAEQHVLRSHFSVRPRTRLQRAGLSDEYRSRLAEIMQRTYMGAEVLSSARYSLRTVDSGGDSYSSFNMGAGEDVLVELLHVLQEAPAGSLIVIEEIELGLHPEALWRLAEHLQEIMWQKKLQVIVSTHSQQFLDAVPRVARVLVQRQGSAHEAIQGPTARFAGGVMAGRAAFECKLYCEDAFAQFLIGAALNPSLRRRAQIVPVGADSELATQALFHQRAQFGELAFLVWDGDVTDADLRNWLQAAVNRGLDPVRVNWCRIPGGVPPETWVLQTLNSPEGCEALAVGLRESANAAQEVVGELLAVMDPHDVVHTLASKRQLEEDEAARILVGALAMMPSDPLAPVRAALVRVLDGGAVQDPAIAP